MKNTTVFSSVVFFLLALSLMQIIEGCSSQTKVAVKLNEHMEIGWTPRSVFQSPSYAAWFDTTYEKYEPLSEYTDRLQNMNENVEIRIVYGIWCSDSKREMPRFFKIMDQIKFPDDRIILIAVDRTMQIPPGIKDEYGITNVPTFIVIYKGMEIGRIIESPKLTLEEDIFELLMPFFPNG